MPTLPVGWLEGGEVPGIEGDDAVVFLTDELRRRQAKEQRGRCFYCHLQLRDDMTWEHLVPRAHGGDNRMANMRVAHRKCNSECVGSLPISWKLALHDVGRDYGSDAFFLSASVAQSLAASGKLPSMVKARRPKRPPIRIHRENVGLLIAYLPEELLLAA